jgi:hypothetical protein
LVGQRPDGPPLLHFHREPLNFGDDFVAAHGALSQAIGRNAMKLSQSAAEAIAIDALTFIASDDELLLRFVALTGTDPAAVRSELEKLGFFKASCTTSSSTRICSLPSPRPPA